MTLKKREYTRATLSKEKKHKIQEQLNERNKIRKKIFHDLPSIVSLIFHSFLLTLVSCNKDFILVVWIHAVFINEVKQIKIK